jgi:hypothetical protein
MDDLLASLWRRALQGDEDCLDAAKAIERLMMDLHKEKAAADQLAARNVALVTENDSLRCAVDYRSRG